MILTRIETTPLCIPLKKPFVTARRSAAALENMLITIHTDGGETGYGEAATVAAVTGETPASVTEAVLKHIAPAVTGFNIEEIGVIASRIQSALYGNHAAKAAVECAAYDLFAKRFNAPLYRLLGGKNRVFENNLTMSAGAQLSELTADCLKAVHAGHAILKIKLGKNPETDAQILKSLWKTLCERKSCNGVRLRVDANQGWTAKEAVHILWAWEDEGLPVECVEQPVPAWDTDGLRLVTRSTNIPVMADESILTVHDAARLLKQRAVDLVNIKLAKTGGPYNALQIAGLCEAYGVRCMMGCMLESRLGAAAAAHVAAAHANIDRVDLDGPLLCANDVFNGGPIFDGPSIRFTDDPGIGLAPSHPASPSDILTREGFQ